MKNICVVTSTRADYGILTPLIRQLSGFSNVCVEICITGAHLLREFGNTALEIECADCRRRSVPIQNDANENAFSVLQHIYAEFPAFFETNRYDLIVVLGDRFEIFGIASVAYLLNVPIAHLHGGETTESAQDEAFRHAITKMSSLHFTTCDAYRNRVVQLGENPETVFNFGALGVENALNVELLSQKETVELLRVRKKYALATYHPVTKESDNGMETLRRLLTVAAQMPRLDFVFTKANADDGGYAINCELEKFAEKYAHIKLFDSLGMRNYLSAVKYCTFVLGNSSSGIIEAPSFHVPTINVGDRQKGRIRAKSVIDCATDAESIRKAIIQAESTEFLREIADSVPNPYEGNNTSKNIAKEIIKALDSGISPIKKFYDLQI